MADRQRLFVDMDGTLAVFTPVDELETLYEKGYFANLAPHDNVIAAVKDIMANHPEIEVHILSAYLTDSQYALQEKNEWLDRYLPEIDQAHRVFIPCGSDKKQGIEGGIRQDDFLLDDYTHNLNDWQPPARGIKLLNAINHTRGSWEHDRIRFDREPSALAEGIVSIMQGRERIFDERINEPMEHKEREFIENLARFDYMRGENNIFPVYEPLSVATNPTAREVYEAERAALERLQNGEYAPARLVVLTSESVGYRNAPHDIAYNRPLTEAELTAYRNDPAEFLEEMYARLGNRDPQPSDYYGHSASVGDAFVVMTPDGANGHYVDGFGFEKEADINRVMTAEQQKAAVMGLTVKEELDMLDSLNEYARASGNEEFEDIVTTETMGRRDFLHDEYTYVFNLAAVREVEEREQDKLAVIYAAEDVPFPEREPLVMGEYDGRYQIAPDAVRAAMPDSRLANGRYVYEDTRVIAGERLQAEIDRRFERATQELSRNASSFYRFEASPTPLGERGQYDAFVQKYDRSADGVGAIPRDIVYIGEARRAAEIAQYLNAGQASEYSSQLLANVELRRERGDLPMQGSDADRDSIAKYRSEYDKWASVSVEGHIGTWHLVEQTHRALPYNNDKQDAFYLLEHDTYGEDAAMLIVNKDGKVVLDDVWNGFDELDDAIDDFGYTLRVLEEAGYTVVSVTDTMGCELEDNDTFVRGFTNYNDLLEHEGELVTAHYNKTIDAMEVAGYHLDLYESNSRNPIYNYEGQTTPLRFDSLKENMEWLDGVVFDDPEVSNAVERIMHPNRFLDEAEPNLVTVQSERTHREEVIADLASRFTLDDIRAELDARYESGDLQTAHNEVFADYTFYDLGGAEKFLQNQDTVLSERVRLGENLIEEWERGRPMISDEQHKEIYNLIRNKEFPLTELESSIKAILNGEVVKDKETVLAERIYDFLEANDPAFGLAEGVDGQESREQWVDTIKTNLQSDWSQSMARVLELSNESPEAREEARAIMSEYAELRGIEPMPNRYYEPELDLNGTADELFVQARNGYIESPEALAKVQEILSNPDEQKTEQAFYVGVLREIAENEGNDYQVYAQMKKDILDDVQPEEVALRDDLTLEVRKEQDNVLIALTESGADREATGASAVPVEQFLAMSAHDISVLVGEVYAYNMVEAEREEEIDRPFEKITIDGHECNVVDRWQDGQNEYVLAQDLVGDDVYYSLENGVSADYLYNYQPSRENVMEDWAMVAADRNMEKVTIDGHECNVVDRWQDGQNEYVLGNDVSDSSFYYAIVNNDISNEFEYDEQPSRERVEDDFSNRESQRSIDRHEAEFGADGERVFPHLNDMQYSENEAIVRLAERIDNIAYQIDPYEYRDTVGVTLEERSESRVELANSIESRDADALQGVVETLTDYRDGLVNDPASANEVRELNDLIYSLEHLDQYEQYYNRETPANAEFAIQEFRGDRVGGRMIEGDQIPMVMSQTPNFSDRSIVARAVMEFEDRNNLPDNERVFHDGMAEDKEFVYGGYDKYVGMSHQNDLSLQPYMERINDLTVGREYQYASPLLMVAEVYYAQQNGLTPEQLDYALDYVKEDRFPADTFRNVRHGLQDGLSVEQLDVLKGESEMNQEYLLEFMHGGSIEDAKALKGMTEVGQYYTVGYALKDGDIDRDMAKCLIQSVNGMRDENRREYEAQRANGEEVRPRYYSMDFEFFSEYLTNAVSKDKSITAENVEAVCKEFMAQKEVSNMKAFIEQGGGFSAFPHREEAIQERSEEVVMPKEEKEIKEGVSIPDDKKDPKERLTEQLQQGVKDVLNSDNFKSWLDTSSKMFLNNYSFNNAMLVWMQRPDATHTMGYEQWKDYGRNVAQGAQGIKIFVPVIAYEKKDGDLWRMIKSNLAAQLKADPSLEQATYKVGMSKLEVTMNRNDLFGLRVNGNEQGIRSEKDMANFIKHNVIGKVPMYFTVGTVFDAKDTIIPEHLWVKKGYKKEELVKDDNGNPIKNRKGEYKIVNTPERQARFNPHLDMSVPEQDPAKMAILYDALKAVSERNGIHVYEKDRDSDDTLKGGADGYYSRAVSAENPKGYIVMPTDLAPTNAVSVMIHEMAHSELHGNLKDLADRMGEDNIPSHMREVQAESVAYIVGKNFGIESDTSSFQYLAAYTKGFELQALSKSIEVIYNECKQLTTELKSELAVRGLNMDLTERENSAMDKEAVQTIGKSYATYAVEQDNRISDIEKELPTLVEQNAGKDNVLSVIVQQGMNIDRQKEDVAVIKEALAKLDSADTLNGQQEAIAQIEAAKARIEGAKTEFSTLNVQLHEQMQNEQGLKDQFLNDPLGTLEAMKRDYPQLAQLTGAQMQYLAKSEYVNRDLAPMLRNDPQQFVDAACERASQIDKVASKNGMFVEVAFCEQWTDKPIVSGGALMHPKVADTIIKQAETQIRGLKAQAEAVDDYFPYSKCALTVFQANNGNIDTAFKTRVDIGDGGQSSLTDHLKQISDANGIVQDFEKATREKGAKDKILFNENSAHGEEAVKDAPLSDRAMSKEEWAQEISNAKNADKSDGSNDRADNSKSVKRNSTNERSE